MEDTNSNASNSRRWTSRWIQLDTSNRNSEYINDFSNEQVNPRSFSEDQNFDDRHSRDQRNRLSPISANPTRYEQPPLFPFRSLRENQSQRSESQRTEQNQVLATSSSDSTTFQQSSDSSVTDTTLAGLSESVDDPIARSANETNHENRSTASDRQQEQQQHQHEDQRNLDDTNFDSSDLDSITFDVGNIDPRESSLGVRQGIQLLSRHIDNMQRLCR